jgi:hypothetical protein
LHALDVLGAGLVASTQQRGEVDLFQPFDWAAAVHELPAPVRHGEHPVSKRRGLRATASGIIWADGALLQHRLPNQAPGQQRDPFMGGQGAGSDEIGQRTEPVRLRQ